MNSMKRRLILAALVCLALVFCAGGAAADPLSGSGTAGDPYQIGSSSDWMTFSEMMRNNYDLYGDKHFELTQDIAVSDKYSPNDTVNGRVLDFGGTFDGGGHTLNFTYSGFADYCAPFRYLQNATVRNLTVTGSVSTSDNHTFAGGIAGEAYDTCLIENCVSAVNISVSGGYDGGLVGLVDSGSTLTIRNCAFIGSMTGGTNLGFQCGGFVGKNNGTLKITDCLFAPSSLSVQNVFYTFWTGYGSATLTRAWRVSDYGNRQGTKAYAEAPANKLVKKLTFAGGSSCYVDGSVSISGPREIYLLSGGTAAISYGVTFDGITLTEGTDYTAAITDSSGETVSNPVSASGTYTLTVTGQGNYAGSAAQQITVHDIPANPENQFYKKLSCDDGYYWLKVTGSISGPNQIYLPTGGTAAISYHVICDGSTLLKDTDYTETVTNSGGETVGNPVGASGTYTLTVTGIGDYAGSLARSYTIYDNRAVPYIDQNGAAAVPVETSPVVVSVTTLSSDTGTGWYAVTEDVTYSNALVVSGDVHLILCDGCTLTVQKGVIVEGNNKLTIYGQSGGTGKLQAGGSSCAGIGSRMSKTCGNITICGGTVIAKGDTSSPGIGCGYMGGGGNIVIYGGTVTATGGSGGAGIGGGRDTNAGSITIYGGTVTANAGNYGAGIGGGDKQSNKGGSGTIKIYGGNIRATGKQGGKGIGEGVNGFPGSIELSWTQATDSIYASDYGENVTLSKNFVLQNTATQATADNIGGKTIVGAFTISFDGNGGTGSVDPATAAYGYAYLLPECGFTPPEGKEFDGWNVDGTVYAPGETVTVTQNMIVQATWKDMILTVDFDANVHGTAPDTQEVVYNGYVTEPDAPEAQGLTFQGWYKEAACVTPWHFDTDAVTEDITLYARWQAISYSVTYALDGGVNAEENPDSYTVLAGFALSAPSRTGYTFTGWTYGSVTEPALSAAIPAGTVGDITFTAHWQGNQYEVRFHGNAADAAGEMANQPLVYGTAQNLTANVFARTGYSFTGWNTAEAGGGDGCSDGQQVLNLTAEDGAVIDLYAQWQAHTYSVVFDANAEDAAGEMAAQSFAYDTAQKLSTCTFTRTGYDFVGWSLKTNGSPVYEDRQEVNNLTAADGDTVKLYAVWKQHDYYVIAPNGFHGSFTIRVNGSDAQCAHYGDAVTLTVHANNGYAVKEDTFSATYGEDQQLAATPVAGTTDQYTFTMPPAHLYATAGFRRDVNYGMYINVNGLQTGESADGSNAPGFPYNNGNAVTPTVTVEDYLDDSYTELTQNTDFTVEFSNNTGEAGQTTVATVTVRGIGDNYAGTAVRYFRIGGADVSVCTVTGTLEAYDFGYGPALSEDIEVWYGNTKLTEGTDYSIDIGEKQTAAEGYFYAVTITGEDNYTGTMTFSVQFVELCHTVVFDANGGTGTIADGTAKAGQHYYLPPCTFTAPYGKEFDHWIASCEPDAEKQPTDYFTAPYIWSLSDVQTITVTAYWRDKTPYTVTASELEHGSLLVNGAAAALTNGAVTVYEGDVISAAPDDGWALTGLAYQPAGGTSQTVEADANGNYSFTMPAADVTVTAVWERLTAPVIAGYDLMLGGNLGLRFYVSLPENFDGGGAYMEFTVAGKSSAVSLENAEISGSYRMFTCNVAAHQMADPITASFHYGNGQTVTRESSVEQYLNSVTDPNAAALVAATKNYGHYVQPYMTEEHGWTYGDGMQHARMSKASDVTALTGLPDFAHRWGTGGVDGTRVQRAQYNLTLDYKTTMNVVVTLKDGVSGTVTATVDGTARTVSDLGNGQYQVAISGIASNQLGREFHIIMRVGENTALDLYASALSYVNTMLQASGTDAEKEALTALYYYYDAAYKYQQP